MLDEILAVAEVQSYREFRIGVAGEVITGAAVLRFLKLGSDAVVVVEFAIDDCMDFAIGGVKRLCAFRREVIDGKSYVAESCGKNALVRISLRVRGLRRGRGEQRTDSVVIANPLPATIGPAVTDLIQRGVEFARYGVSSDFVFAVEAVRHCAVGGRSGAGMARMILAEDTRDAAHFGRS